MLLSGAGGGRDWPSPLGARLCRLAGLGTWAPRMDTKDDIATCVLDTELRSAKALARSDLGWLSSAVKSALADLDERDGGETGAANQVAGAARTAAHSLMQVAIVRGKLEGLALARAFEASS